MPELKSCVMLLTHSFTFLQNYHFMFQLFAEFGSDAILTTYAFQTRGHCLMYLLHLLVPCTGKGNKSVRDKKLTVHPLVGLLCLPGKVFQSISHVR